MCAPLELVEVVEEVHPLWVHVVQLEDVQMFVHNIRYLLRLSADLILDIP